MKPEKPDVSKLDGRKLGAELFGLVEADQGYAFISDGLGYNGDVEKVFNVARGALRSTESSAKKIRRFLKKYGQEP